jgi:TRAP-type mannitol/chloroaromatic compound transport system permease small subunit
MRSGGPLGRLVDTANEWVGRAASLMLYILVAVVTVEVILRYIFNRPSIWNWDIMKLVFAMICVLGAGYVLLHGKHVIIDVIVSRFSPRVRAIINLVTSGFFFLGVSVLVWISFQEAGRSIAIKENITSIWSPPLYPLRVIWVIGVILLLLQGIIKLVRDVNIARTGREEAS